MPQGSQPLGQRKLEAVGIPARAAQGIAKLSKDGGWLLTIPRAQELALMPPAARVEHARSYPTGPKPAATPEKKPATPRKKPAAQPDTPAKPTPRAPRIEEPAHRHQDPDPIGRPLAEEIRAVGVEVARAYAAYQDQLTQTDPDDEDALALLQRKQTDWLRLTKASASLSASLKDSEQLGDTRSLASILNTLAEASSLIRADIDSIPDRLAAEMSGAGGVASQAAATARDLARTIVDRALAALSRRFKDLTTLA